MFDIEKAKSNGISIEVMKRINENTAKRNSCKIHDFKENKTGMFVCKNCNCKENSFYVRGYNDALKHAKEL